MQITEPAAQNARYFRPRRLGHVNLWVDDIQKSENFYSEVCGLKVEFTEPDLIATFLGTGHTPHDLGMMQKTNGVPRYGRNGLLQLPGTIGLTAGLNHLAWELKNEAELVQGYRHLKQDDIETDITVDHQVAHSVYMFDPDGNYNEFYCDTVKDWRKVLTGPMELLTSHWDPLQAEGFTEGRYEETPVLEIVESAPVHPWRLTHATLQTPRLEEMVEFYTTIAGLRVVAREAGVVYLVAGMDDYDYNLVLVSADDAAYHHASFQLKDEAALERAKRVLPSSGVTIEQETRLPWKHSIFLRDPDGLLSEWYVPGTAPRDLAARGGLPLAMAV
ncbi:VOC family protein [Pusillimonas sp. CC-YST705]|uniref:VOC family protein n=1 Tax=Mesopusillimonas faecipullorum TaxID=2755040 RepID=A0ABS8CAA0_9BURK|nr:VOC family protein [Mesopusillimonas faecipullorum]MCB5362966.1 VOC family protein [Mesopusillimonas faecipullorum]